MKTASTTDALTDYSFAEQNSPHFNTGPAFRCTKRPTVAIQKTCRTPIRFRHLVKALQTSLEPLHDADTIRVYTKRTFTITVFCGFMP
jgi:hypothetical protein